MAVWSRLVEGALLALPLALMQTSAGTADVPMGSFRSDALRLQYSFPASYKDASAIVVPAFEASTSNDPSMAAVVHCLSMPLSRMSMGAGQVAMVLLVRVDAGCMKKKFSAGSLPELTEGEAKGLAASGAKVDFGKPQPFEVAGKPGSLTTGSFTLPTGQLLHSLVACVLDQPDVACWQFLSNTPEALRTMGAFPVTFDGQPTAPLIPAGTVTGSR